jgi:hypothetical protein
VVPGSEKDCTTSFETSNYAPSLLFVPDLKEEDVLEDFFIFLSF